MEYDLMKQSLLKNLQEFSEECVDNYRINNYYELSDLIVDLWNIRAKLIKKDKKLYENILKELESE